MTIRAVGLVGGGTMGQGIAITAAAGRHDLVGMQFDPHSSKVGRVLERGHPERVDAGLAMVRAAFEASKASGDDLVAIGDAEPAAEVEVAERRPFLAQVDVVAARLQRRAADVADVRDLRAEVVVQELHAIEHLVLAQGVEQAGQQQARERRGQ